MAVYADTSEAGSLEGLLWEPMVSVPSSQHVDEGLMELLERRFGDVPPGQADQMHQEIGRR